MTERKPRKKETQPRKKTLPDYNLEPEGSLKREILRELDRRGWNFHTLSKLGGLQYSSVNLYLGGDKRIRSDSLQKILDLLDLQVVRKDELELLTEFEITRREGR